MFKKVDAGQSFPKMEEEILKFWEGEKIFEKSLEKTKGGKPYTFYDGPPFATGTPHYGHLLASALATWCIWTNSSMKSDMMSQGFSF